MPLESQLNQNWSIYKITSPSNRVYIGVSKNLKERLRHYGNGSCKNQTSLDRSIRKYGFKAHSTEVIDKFYSDATYAYGKEIYWIRTYMCNRSKFPEMNGLNLTDGGSGGLGRVISDSTKQKLREANLGKKYSQEVRNKLSKLRKGKKLNRVMTDEQKKSISLLHTGRKHTDEVKRIIGEHSKGNKHCLGKKQSNECIENRTKYVRGNKFKLGIPTSAKQKLIVSKMFSKPILQYDLFGNFIKEHQSLRFASKELGISVWSIWSSARGDVKKPKRFIFKYKPNEF